MAGTALTFHLPFEASLNNILHLVDGLWRAGNPQCTSRAQLLDAARQIHELPLRAEVTDFAQRIGVISASSPWGLTPRAIVLICCPSPVQRDLLHYLAYCGWSPDSPASQAPYWSYRHTVDLLWNKNHVALKTAADLLVEEVVGNSRTHFACIDGYDPERVSFSKKSVRGIVQWLDALQPPTIMDGIFSRRQTCSAELIVLALGEAARHAGVEPGNDLLLSQDRREAMCRLCLLDPGYLDRLLDWATLRFPAIIAPGMRGGSYGRSVRLLRAPSVEDLGI